MIKLFCCALVGSAALALSGCSKTQPARTEFAMGERVPVGQMTYSVVQSAWKTELGESFQARSPENRFLLLKLSVTNGTGQDVSIPFLTVEGSNGQMYREVEKGDGVDNWFGVLRTISPGQTQQGNILFDVPLSSYKLRIPDIADPGLERYVLVNIPLQLDSELPIQSPVAPGGLK